MKVKELMTTPVATCHPEMNLAEAIALMWERDCGALPAIGEAGQLAGILTDRDICIALGTRNVRASDLCVRDIVGNHTLACKASDEVTAALQTMREGKVRRLPVINDGAKLEGIVSMDDVVLNARPSKDEMEYLVSYEDAVTTLQAIYSRGQFHGRTAAA